jgi:hypothetical protein
MTGTFLIEVIQETPVYRLDQDIKGVSRFNGTSVKRYHGKTGVGEAWVLALGISSTPWCLSGC